ncbi:MAG: hypothetical protein ACTSQE_03300 [Candidatus Heimdallarchaeaceae archaeon]
MSEKANTEILFRVEASRFGWKDFILNLISSLIMIGAIFFTIFFFKSENIGDWLLAFVVIFVPLLIFSNRLTKELFYPKDFIQITNDKYLVYRSTPLLVTGLRIRKAKFPLVDIRRYGLAKIPRKLSLDLYKHKNKAMLLVYNREGKEIFLGEYIEDEKLAELCKIINQIYPRAKLVGDKSYLKLAKVEDKQFKDKKIKETDIEDEPEGVFFRKR